MKPRRNHSAFAAAAKIEKGIPVPLPCWAKWKQLAADMEVGDCVRALPNRNVARSLYHAIVEMKRRCTVMRQADGTYGVWRTG